MHTIGDGSNGYPVNQNERQTIFKILALKEANQELLEALELIVHKHHAQESLDGAISVAMSYISKYRGQS